MLTPCNNLRNNFEIINKELFEQSKEVYSCMICQDILYNPVACSNCYTLFCEACIKKWLIGADFCPDGCAVSEIKIEKINNQTRKILDKLKLKCIHNCEVPFTHYFDHLEHCEIERKIKSNNIACWNCNNLAEKNNIKELTQETYLNVKERNEKFRNLLIEQTKSNDTLILESNQKLNNIKNLLMLNEKKKQFDRIIYECEIQLQEKEKILTMIELWEKKLHRGDSIETT